MTCGWTPLNRMDSLAEYSDPTLDPPILLRCASSKDVFHGGWMTVTNGE